MSVVIAPCAIERDDRWEIPISGEVWGCNYRFRFELMVGDDASKICISNGFEIETAEETFACVPEDIASMAPSLCLLRKTICGCDAFKTGALEIRFSDGTQVRVPAYAQWEAWEACGKGGLLMVAVPGGDVAVWDAQVVFE